MQLSLSAAAMDDNAESSQVPLLSSAFFASHRTVNDVYWGRSLLLFVSLTLGIGSLLLLDVKRSHAIDVYTDTDWLEEASHCVLKGGAPQLQVAPTTILSYPKELPHGMSLPYVLLSSTALIGSFIAASALLCSFFLCLLQVAPSFVVWFSLFISQIAFPLALAYYAAASGNTGLAIIILISTVVLGILYVFNAESIRLVSRLLGVSAHALSVNPGLLLLLIGVKISLICFTLLIVVFSVSAAARGRALPNHSVSVIGEDGHCLGLEKQHVPCCVWQSSSLTPYYLLLSSFTLVWVNLLAFEVKLFTIGGTIAAWYFSPAGSSVPQGALRSLGYALGPSLGSLSLSSLVMMAVSHTRMVLERFRQQRDRHGILPSIVSCFASCILDLIRAISRFSTIYMSFQGTNFFQSCTEVIDLLSRNAMDAYNAWWLPPLVLKLPCLLCSLVMGYSSYFVAIMLWGHSRPSSQTDGGLLHLLALSVSILATLSVWATLSFFASALLDVVDSVFVCYAVDRDVGACSQAQVHDVLQDIPGCKPLQGSVYQVAQGYPTAYSAGTRYNVGTYYPGSLQQSHQPHPYPDRQRGGWSASPLSPMASQGYAPYLSPFQPQHQPQAQIQAQAQDQLQLGGSNSLWRPHAPMAHLSPLVYSPSLDNNTTQALIASLQSNQTRIE